MPDDLAPDNVPDGLAPGRDPVAALTARLRSAGCVFAEEEAALLLADGRPVEELAGRRLAGEPLEHILGWVEFDGLRLAVGPGVFVPRGRTALLVDESLRRMDGEAIVVELCAGVGAISAAILERASLDGSDRDGAGRRDRRVTLHAVEIDPVAVALARRNVEPRGGVVHVGDLDAPLPRELAGRVGILVANAPYVPSAEVAYLPAEARDHEPRTALDGGCDGLDLARRIVDRASRWLAPGGALIIETSTRQAPALARCMSAAGLAADTVRDDDLDATAVIGTAPRERGQAGVRSTCGSERSARSRWNWV